jgi:cobalt-zinc-cadmium efflux system membrane fusion protein
MQKKSNRLAIIAAIFALALAGYAYWSAGIKKEDDTEEHHEHHKEGGETEKIELTPSQAREEGVILGSAGPGIIQRLIQAPGILTLNADRVAHVVPKVAGIAQEAKKNLGEKISQGSVLAILESREMAEAKTQYLAALKKELLTQSFLQLEQQLHDKKITAAQDYETTKAAAESASIDTELAKQKLYALGMDSEEIEELPAKDPSNLRIYEMRSPISGTVIERHMITGEALDTTSEAFVLADLQTVWADLTIYPQDLPYVAENMKVTIAQSNGKSIESKIIFVSPVIDRDTRTARAIALVDNSSGEWHPGSFITAIIPAETFATPLVVSADAVHKIDGESCVFLVQDDGFEIRPVKVGRTDGHCIEIIAGITPGDSYASENTFLLKAEHGKSEATHED